MTMQKQLTASPLYPKPIQAPVIPYKLERKRNPRLHGWALLIVAYFVERVSFLKKRLWYNAGFASLSGVRQYIEQVEPRFDPTVFPSETQSIASDDSAQAREDSPPVTYRPLPSHRRYSVADYRSLYLSGELTPLAVARAILPLIRRDTSPPGEHSVAWLQVRADLVLKAAKASTLRYQQNKSLGNLDGVPTAVKDEYDVEGYSTCLGSAHNLTGRAPDGETIDSWCVRKLEQAGAIVLGKLTMVEIGMDTCGGNPIHGTPRNPYNEHYYTGGSSSGCAYAVATGLIPIAMGSDGGGSIRIPSSFCSVFGLKPSLGRISYHPRLNVSSTAAVNGPIATDMKSLAEIYAVAAQPHPLSRFGSPIAPIGSCADYSNRPKVIGLPEAWFQSASPTIQQLCRDAITRLVDQKGYTVVPVDIPFIAQGKIALSITMLTNVAAQIPDPHGLSATSRILVALGQVTPATDYLLAQKLRHVIMSHLAWLWKTYPGMVIVTPTTACPGWPIRTASELTHGVSDGDQTLASMEYVWLANFCGVPSLTVPVGYVVPEGEANAGKVASLETEGKVPVGLMATGEWTTEDTLMLFGMDAEEVGAESQCRPPNWVDVVELAKKEMAKNN